MNTRTHTIKYNYVKIGRFIKIRQGYIPAPIPHPLILTPNELKKIFLILIWSSFLYSQLVNSQEHFKSTPTPAENRTTPTPAPEACGFWHTVPLRTQQWQWKQHWPGDSKNDINMLITSIPHGLFHNSCLCVRAGNLRVPRWFSELIGILCMYLYL